jgi:NADP-dependent 3-hydroxy acid dehydrogenase YdfG
MTSLDGRTAVVSGASRGIGLAVASRLEAAGAWVMRLARTLEPSTSPTGVSLACDVTDDAQVRAAREELHRHERHPDILVNSAGTFLLKDLTDITPAEFRDQVQVNLLGPFVVLRELVDAVAEAGGHVVTIGSIADHVALPGNAAYGASKYGVRALHEVLCAEYRGRLRTTLVSPGPTDTAMWDPLDPDTREDLPDRAAMLRPDDVADAVLYALTRPRHTNVDLIRVSPSGLS